MARFLRRNFPPSLRKYAGMILALFWCAGLFCGVSLYSSAGGDTASLMRAAVLGRVSIVSLLFSELLPFLFSAFAVYLDMPRLLYGCAFVKAVLFSFFSLAALDAFGSAGWLVRLLLMFSDILMCGLLYYYWLGHVSGDRHFSALRCGTLCAVSILIGSIDYCFIAPFLGRIIEF